MRLYRRAIQIDPDIEFKIYEANKLMSHHTNEKNLVEIARSIDATAAATEADEENLDGVDLITRFNQSMERRSGGLIQKATDKSVLTTGAHFSDIPTEIILLILKWVVSSDLDLRSLEDCSMVSKGFYLCARDPEIWRQACLK